MCFLFVHCYYVQKHCLNFEFENEQHNSKFKDDKIKKIIPILKKCTWYFLVILSSLICGVLLAVKFPNIRILITNMLISISNLITLATILIILIYIFIKVSGIHIKKIISTSKKNKTFLRYIIAFEILVLLIIPFLFYMISVLLKSSFEMSSSDYFNYLGVIFTAEFSFASLQYQISVTRKDEKETLIRRDVISGMESITGTYQTIHTSLIDAQGEWNQNKLSQEYSSLNFEKMRTFLIKLSNYDFTCQQKNELFTTFKFDSISNQIRKLNSEVARTLAIENSIITQLSEEEGEIDSRHRQKICQMNDCLKEISDIIEKLDHELTLEVLDLKVNNKKIKPMFEHV